MKPALRTDRGQESVRMRRPNRVRMDHSECPEGLAGAGGFEPPHGGIKVRCLTTWLRPNAPFLRGSPHPYNRSLSCEQSQQDEALEYHTRSSFAPRPTALLPAQAYACGHIG